MSSRYLGQACFRMVKYVLDPWCGNALFRQARVDDRSLIFWPPRPYM